MSKPESFESASGIGGRGRADGKALALGNHALMTEEGVDVGALRQEAESLREEGASVMFLAVDGSAAGLVAVSDPVKDSTPAALSELREAGLRLIMATGDGETTARSVARTLGIDEVHGEVRPQDKADLVATLQAQGRRVGMAGDRGLIRECPLRVESGHALPR